MAFNEKNDKEAIKRRRAMEEAAKKYGKSSQQYLQARGTLNDYLSSKGAKVNRISGEISNGQVINSGPKLYKPNLSTPQGVTEADLTSNRLDQVSPEGSISYKNDPITGRTTKTIEQTGQERQISDAERAGQISRYDLISNTINPRLQENLGSAYSYDGISKAPQAIDPTLFAPEKMQEEIYGQFKRRLDDRFSQERNTFAQNLADQGIPMGSERYNRELQDFDRRKNDAYLDASAQAFSMAGDQGSRLFSNAKNAFDMGMNQRQQGIAEYDAQRYAPYQEMANLLSFQRGGSTPQETPSYQSPISNTALGFQGFENAAKQREWEAGERAKDRSAQLQGTRIAAGNSRDPISDYAEKSRIDFNNSVALMNEQARLQGGSLDSGYSNPEDSIYKKLTVPRSTAQSSPFGGSAIKAPLTKLPTPQTNKFFGARRSTSPFKQAIVR